MRAGDGLTVVIAGATSVSGLAATRTLRAAGAQVVAVGRDRERLLAHAKLGARVAVCDLSDEEEVLALAERTLDHGGVDGVLHLVGGWRGGGGLAGQTDADYRALETGLTALRHVSRVFDAALRASPRGRLAIVSSTATERPLAGGANYAAVKAGMEAWSRAIAQGYAKAARDAGEPPHTASVIFRVKSLAGLEDTLAEQFAGLFAKDAAAVNDTVMALDPA